MSTLSKPDVREEIVVARTTNPEEGTLTEIACLKAPDEEAKTYPVYLRIEGEKIVQISENAGFAPGSKLYGHGTVIEADWSSISMDLTYSVPGGEIQIHDINWIDDGVLRATKEIFWKSAGGAPPLKTAIAVARLAEISKAEYEQRRSELGCP